MTRVLKKGMSINCRTDEEVQVFKEFAHTEGHKTADGGSILKWHRYAPCSFQIEYQHRKFPNSISTASEGFDNCVVQVEASDLFRNQLISRRIKCQES